MLILFTFQACLLGLLMAAATTGMEVILFREIELRAFIRALISSHII